MRSGTAKRRGSSMPLSHWVFLVFLVLKLCSVIDWSWLWVTAPLWLGLVVVLIDACVGEAIGSGLED